MRTIRNRFIAGLLIIIPAAVTWWVIWKIFHSVDSMLRPVQQRIPAIDVPGIGFGVVLLLILLTGIFAGNFIGRRIISRFERVLYRLPIIRRIYTGVKELSQLFIADRRMVFHRVVLIRYPHEYSRALAFVTDDSARGLDNLVGSRVLSVFVPTTPNPTSGFLLIVPEDDVVTVPIDVEEGLKMVISGGVYVPDHLKAPPAPTSAV